MKEPLYVIGSEPLGEWEQRNDCPSRIVLTGDVSANTFSECACDFDYTKYELISLENLTVQDVVGEYGYTRSYAEHLSEFAREYWAELPLLGKLYLNSKNIKSFVVSEGNVLSADHKTLVHTPEANELIVPEYVEHIGDGACCGYEKMSKVRLSRCLKSIGKFAFADTGIENIDMPDTLVSLGEYAFLGARLEKVRLSDSLSEIPDGCFNLCCLDNIVIPKSVKHIGNKALRALWADEIKIPEGVERIGYDALTHLLHVSLPSTLKEIAPDFYYEECIDDPEYPPYIEVHPDNKVFFSKDGSLYFKETGELAIDSKYNGLDENDIRILSDGKDE